MSFDRLPTNLQMYLTILCLIMILIITSLIVLISTKDNEAINNKKYFVFSYYISSHKCRLPYEMKRKIVI